MTRVRVFVSGKVQGVWFREATREQAERLRLDGWVRNLPDGRVEAVFVGPDDAVREAVAWCRQGPSAAEVADVHATLESEPDPREGPPGSGFRVLR